MQERRNTVTLVLGGVRSGKSRYAQALASRSERVTFVATAKACDAEMEAKIAKHQAERPLHWRTVEEPISLHEVILASAPNADLVLVDCLTIYASHLLEAGCDAAESLSASLLAVLRDAPVEVILVSNEVGWGVVPPYASGRQYRDLLEELNQKVASVAQNVILMVAGLPLVLKGNLEREA